MTKHVKPLSPPKRETDSETDPESEAEHEKETLTIDEPEQMELSEEVQEAIRRRHRFGQRCRRATGGGPCNKPATWIPKGADRTERPACVLHVELPATRWRPPVPAVQPPKEPEAKDDEAGEQSAEAAQEN